MRKIFSLGAAFLLMLTLSQCVEKTNEPVPVPPDNTISVNDTVFFKAGDKVLVLPDKFEMGFDRVIKDTRCPINAVCLYPGEGVIRLWIKKPKQDTIYIHIGLMAFDQAMSESQLIPIDTMGLRFSLVALYPRPVDFEPIPPEDYLAGVEVKEFEYRISAADGIIITEQPPDSIELDPFNLYRVQTIGDSLKVGVRYTGGCEEHSFRLYMTPPTFSDDDPFYNLLEAKLYLRHDAAGDACEAYLRHDIYFDLSPVARLYEDIYGRRDTIVVSVYYYRTGYDEKKSDLYLPGD